MAKHQTFAEKSKVKKKEGAITVKLIKTVKTSRGTYKFSERYVKISDIGKISEIK